MTDTELEKQISDLKQAIEQKTEQERAELERLETEQLLRYFGA